MRLAIICLAGSVPLSTPVLAQADPSSVTLPDMRSASDPRSFKEGWKYFFFHKEGVSYAQAHADFSDCYRFLRGPMVVGPAPLPNYGARRSPAKQALSQPDRSQYGLVGDIMGSMIAGPMQRRLWQSRLRRCMEPRGYARYGIDEATWKLLTDGYSPRSIILQAKAASGPRPTAKVITQ